MTNMYYQRFGLAGPAFESSTPQAALFLSTPYRQAFAAMEWGLLHEGSGFSLLAGEPGTGKTTLINALVAQHSEQVHAVLIQNSRLRLDEIMLLIVEQLGLKDVPDTRLGLWRAIEGMIAALKPNERVVVIIDEAQSLDDARMEDLRLLSNCDANHPRHLHFILAGQPELLSRLQTPTLRNLNQRIGARAKLVALNRDEAWDYIDYRLQQVGGGAEKLFERRALRRLISASGGILRQINLLCTAAIACAHAQNERLVTLACAKAAIAEYRNLYRPGRTFVRRFAAAGVAASVTAVAAAALAAVLVVRHEPVPQQAPQMQLEPTTEAGSRITAEAPLPAVADKLPEIDSEHDGAADSAGKLPALSAAVDPKVMAIAHPADAAQPAQKPADGDSLGNVYETKPLETETAPAATPAPAPAVEANAASPQHVVARARHSKRNRHARHVTRQDDDSYQDEPDGADPSDSPPIDPDYTGSATDAQ
jgi:general secretion pathway protein A